jgi:hypothetical protein
MLGCCPGLEPGLGGVVGVAKDNCGVNTHD